MCGFLAEFNLNDDYSDGLKPTIDSNAEAYILRRGPDGLQKLKDHCKLGRSASKCLCIAGTKSFQSHH